MKEVVLTTATALTVTRAVISSAVLIYAILEQSHGLLLAGLGISMLLDFVDGHLARAANSETVTGAQWDGLADRMATALTAAGAISMDHESVVILAAAAVWLQFGVVDQFFASQFLRFGLWSSDHFYEVDEMLGLESELGERVWRLNWSPLAKLASNLSILFLALGAWWAALILSLTLVVIRIPDYSAIQRLARKLPDPTSPSRGISSARRLPLTRHFGSGRRISH
jgi:phosphatidylglycerophosphate synthase